MSDELPFHIQEAILKRLPIKSLIQFRSVSRTWKSLIDSSEFIAAHSISHTQPQHLFVWYTDTQEDKYVSFVDDDSFPQHSKDGYDIFNEEQLCCTVWMVEHGVERSFTKLFTIEAPGDLMRAVGFRRKGGPIMEVQDYIFESTEELVVYEPNSEQSNHLISGSSFIVNSYIETLVLLGSSDCSSY
ncbi:hypothetical protein Lser_V15G05119 [Lactuca serriola]